MAIYKISTGTVTLDALPVSFRCPSCRHIGIFVGLPKVSDGAWTKPEPSATGGIKNVLWRVGVRTCPNVDCGAVAFVVLRQEKVVETFPPELISFDPVNLPAPILSSLEEAVQCHAAGAYKASALMVRRLLEELCRDRGAKGSDLNQRLKALSATIVVPAELLEAANEIRLLGNDAAHIDAKSYDRVGQEESALAIELATELLKAVYQYASLVARMRGLKKD